MGLPDPYEGCSWTIRTKTKQGKRQILAESPNGSKWPPSSEWEVADTNGISTWFNIVSLDEAQIKEERKALDTQRVCMFHKCTELCERLNQMQNDAMFDEYCLAYGVSARMFYKN